MRLFLVACCLVLGVTTAVQGLLRFVGVSRRHVHTRGVRSPAAVQLLALGLAVLALPVGVLQPGGTLPGALAWGVLLACAAVLLLSVTTPPQQFLPDWQQDLALVHDRRYVVLPGVPHGSVQQVGRVHIEAVWASRHADASEIMACESLDMPGHFARRGSGFLVTSGLRGLSDGPCDLVSNGRVLWIHRSGTDEVHRPDDVRGWALKVTGLDPWRIDRVFRGQQLTLVNAAAQFRLSTERAARRPGPVGAGAAGRRPRS